MKKIKNPQLYSFARILTYIFSPAGMFISLSIILFIKYIPTDLTNIIIWFGSTLLLLMIGVLFLFVLKKKSLISDFNISKREERPIYFFPLLAVLIALTTLNFIWGWNEIDEYLALITFTYGIAFIITLFYKISIHVLSVTLECLILAFVIKNIWVLLLIPIPLITAWTRVYLKKHTYQEVIAGLLLPIATTILWMIATVDVTSL